MHASEMKDGSITNGKSRILYPTFCIGFGERIEGRREGGREGGREGRDSFTLRAARDEVRPAGVCSVCGMVIEIEVGYSLFSAARSLFRCRILKSRKSVMQRM